MLCCTPKLPDEACISHVKCIGKNKSVLQLKHFAEVLHTGLTLKKNTSYRRIQANSYLSKRQIHCRLLHLIVKIVRITSGARCYKIIHAKQKSKNRDLIPKINHHK